MIDSSITIEVPGERIRGTVVDVISADKIIVELTNLPLSKSHDYKQGNFVECHLESNVLGNAWTAKHKMNRVEEIIEEVKDVRIRKSYK